MDAPPRPQDTTSDVIAKWNRDYFNPRYAKACLCHEYLVEFPDSPRYAIYLVDLGMTPDGQPMALRNDIFNTTPEGLSRIDVFDQPEPGSPRKRMLGRMIFLAPRAPEPWQLGEHVRFEPTEPPRRRRSPPESRFRRHSRPFQYREPPSIYTPMPVAAWAAPPLDHWSGGGATTNPPVTVIYGEDYGRSGSHRRPHDRQSDSRRVRQPSRHVELSNPPETTRAPGVPIPSGPDINYPPPSPSRTRSTSPSSTNPPQIIGLREQSRRSEQPGSSRSHSRPAQLYATDLHYPLSNPVGRQSNPELGRESRSSRDSFHTASHPPRLPPIPSPPQPVIRSWLTDNGREGGLGGQDPWGFRAHASTEPARGSGRDDFYTSHYEPVPTPPPPPPPLTTLEADRREGSVSAPQAVGSISPLEGQWQRDEISLRLLLGEYPSST